MAFSNRQNQVRRVDALLRARFPHLTTRIFEVAPEHYTIWFNKAIEDAARISAVFDDEIRYLTLIASVSNTMPQAASEIPALTDEEAMGSFSGLGLRVFDIQNLIHARFPDLPQVKVRDEPPTPVVFVITPQPFDQPTQDAIRAFLASVGLEPKNITIETGDTSGWRDLGAKEDVLFIHATRNRIGAPKYARADEAFWFDNLTSIAEGRLTPERFPGMTDRAYRCHLDLTQGEHIDLRQALFLYDEVYCSLPLAHDLADFLKRQRMDQKDLLEIAGAGRLKIVTTQPDERLHVPFLDALHERAPEAILGRRTTAALLLAEVTQTASLYRLDDPACTPGVRALCGLLAPALKISPDELSRALLWPLEARRAGLMNVLDRGSKGSPVVQLGTFLSDLTQANGGQDIGLEMYVLGERVHIAHALNATHITPLDEPAGYGVMAEQIGRNLNFYSNFNRAIIASWAANERRRADGVQIMPPIKLLEFHKRVPMEEFLDESLLPSTRAKGRGLMARMAELSDYEREAEFDRIEAELRAKGRAKEGKLLTFDTLNTLWSLGALFLDFTSAPVAGTKNFALKGKEALRKILPAIDDMVSELEGDIAKLRGTNQDLDFLRRINRVAYLAPPPE